MMLLHYLVKFRSRSLAVYNNEFTLGSACFGIFQTQCRTNYNPMTGGVCKTVCHQTQKLMRAQVIMQVMMQRPTQPPTLV